MRILILTRPLDVHALAVQKILERRGHKVVKWFISDFPSRQWISFSISNDEPFVSKVIGAEIWEDLNEIDLVWLRRPSRPSINYQSLDKRDHEFVREEVNRFYQSLWHVISMDSIWINPFHGHKRANSKILQIKLAKKCGLAIPDTLVSNNPTHIREFLRNSRKSRVVYKCFGQRRWMLRDGGMAAAWTSIVSEDKLPEDEILQETPGIFQHYIEKQHEVRAVFFDDYDISVRINSQSHDDGKTDWRMIPLQDMYIERVDIPACVKEKCIKLMRELGIRFGCFDFAVTDNGNYVFFEVN